VELAVEEAEVIMPEAVLAPLLAVIVEVPVKVVPEPVEVKVVVDTASMEVAVVVLVDDEVLDSVDEEEVDSLADPVTLNWLD
jgi:hypothetical protein